MITEGYLQKERPEKHHKLTVFAIRPGPVANFWRSRGASILPIEPGLEARETLDREQALRF